MTFKEMSLREDELLSPYLRRGSREKVGIQAFVENQSPIMKLWFAIMVLNFVMFLFIL